MAKKDLKNMGTEAAKLAERLEKAEQKKKQAAKTASASASAGNSSRGSYHSPREYGANTGTLEAQMNTARAAMEERAAPLNQCRANVEKLRSAAAEAEQNYYATKGKFRGANAAQYEQQMMDVWTTATKAYSESYIALERELEEYRPYETAYNNAVGAYNSYVTAERAAYADWRGTIRDAESIRAEQRELKQARQELVNRMQFADQYGPDNEERIAELQTYLGGTGDREKLLQEELEWSEHFLYEDLRSAEDFTEKSRYQTTANGGKIYADPLGGGVFGSAFGDPLYDYVNRNAEAVAAQTMNNHLNDMSYLQSMTDDEVAMYNYVYATQSAEAASGYLDTIRTQLTARQQGATNELIGQAAVAGGAPGMALGSLISVGLSPFSGLQSAAGQLASVAAGKGLDPNAGYNLATNAKNAIRQEVGAEAEKAWGPVGSFGYGVAMSMADMLMDASFGSAGLAKAMIGSRAMAESVMDAKSRGLSDGQALTLGTVSAAAELVTEKLGLDELLKLKDADKAKKLFGRILSGASGEALEEGATNVINLVADIIVAGDKSAFRQSVEAYRAEGWDDGQAFAKAVGDAAKSLGADMVGGSISGGVFAGWRGAQGRKAAYAKAEKKAGDAPKMETADNVTDRTDNTSETIDNTTGARNAQAETVAGVAEEGSTTAVEKSVVGAENATTTETKGPEAPAENGDMTDETGERVLSGGVERADRAGAGEQIEPYEQRRERQQREAQSADQTAAQRRIKAENLEKLGRAQRVSLQDMGIRQGAEARTVLELPKYEWDEDLYNTVNRLEKETGYKVRCVTGNFSVKAKGGGTKLVRGCIDRVTGQIVLNVAHSTVTADQIADHELYHWKMDAIGRISGDRHQLTREAVRRIREEYDEDSFDAILDSYLDGYGEVYDTGDEMAFLERIYEEIMADAYAGINAFGAEASKFQRTVERVMDENGMGRDVWNAAEQEDVAAPGGDQRVYTDEEAPPEREYEDYSQVPQEDWDDWDDSMIDFSYGGEKAEGADTDALERAKEMEAQGFTERQIFQETGCFLGADGKWRFEIDDSGAKYRPTGDAQFRKDHPEYQRFRELERKFIDAVITDAEIAELAELRTTWGNEPQRLRQLVARGNAKLYMVLEHDALYEQYPQLRDVKVRFSTTDEAGGWWDAEQNEIVLSNRFRHADPNFLELTLMHEIQHAIQTIEGFANGSNPEYWEDIQKSGRAIRENDRKFAEAERDAQEALKDIPPDVAKDFWYAANMMETDPEGAQEIRDRLDEGEYSDAFWDYDWAISTVRELLEEDNPKRTAKDLYYNTAGEIEAYDVANRLGLTAEERKKRLPNTGDERTVFAERGALQYSIGLDATEDERYKELQNRTISVIQDQRSGKYAEDIAAIDALPERAKSKVEKIVRPLAKKLGILNRAMRTPELEIDFEFSSNKGLKESLSKQLRYGGRYTDFAKALIHLDEVLENAVLIERHSDKYKRTVRENRNLKMTHVLMGAFEVEDGIIPVQMEIKETVDTVGKLYMTVAMTKIEADVMGSTIGENRARSLLPASTYSLAEIFAEINPMDAHFLKYVPDGFLSPLQINAKHSALDEDARRIAGYAKKPADDRDSAENTDIRFSVDDEELTREAYDRLMVEVAGDQSKRNDAFIRERLTPEQYKQFKMFQKEDRMDAEAEARVRGIERFERAMEREELEILRTQQAEDAAAGRRELKAEERAAAQQAAQLRQTAKQERKDKARREREKAQKEAKDRVRRAGDAAPTGSSPTIAKKELQDKLIGLFSVGEGQRNELRRMIGELADRMIAEGSLDDRDLRRLIDRLYDSGVMVIEPEEVFAEGRSYVKDERIYISPELIRELGDDWETLRKRAWGLGVYLTTDRKFVGLDVWNQELAAYLPGMFNENETDQRTMLERLLWIAEEGRTEKISLVEYTKRIAKAEHQSEQALLENMERQVEEALRTFAEKARLETRLKDRAARQRAMDKEERAIARENERAERKLLREELADEREYHREQNAAERGRIEQQRAEMELRNASERRRLAEERAARRKKSQEAERKKELKELQQKTLNVLNWIAKNRRKAPEAMQAAMDEVLGNIDLYAISIADEMNWSSKHQATWKDLKRLYLHAQAEDPNFLPSDDLQRIVDRLDKTQLEELDLDQLRDLYQAAVGLRTEFQNRNNVIGDAEWEMMEELYSGCVEEMRAAPKKLKGMLDRFLNLEQLTPMNVFEEMGGFNPDGMLYRFAKQLEAGEKAVRSFKVRSNKLLADFLTENEEWVRKADGQGEDGIWHEVEIPELIAMKVGEAPQFGGTVKVWMTPMQKVHLYLESRNYDNLRHMTGGRSFPDKELYSKGEREEAFGKGTTIRMAPETVQLLVKDLTPQERELAELLDRYYNDLAKTEINKVSNVLLGYDKAMGGKYAPIFTNGNYTKSEFGKYDGTAEGVGNLKERVKSKLPSYNISALEAFERNMDRTATYVGMAIPARNWNTLMNWRTSNSSFADEITHTWGKRRLDYIQDLVTDLQNPMGEQQDMVSELAGKVQSNYISATFGFNPGIVVKQLGSIPMASAYLGWEHFPKDVIGKGKIDRELIGKYTQELEWRTMGYSMPETKQLKDAPNWSQKNKTVGLIFGGDAITAMDGWAASVLWPWAENKVRADFPDLEVGDAATVEAGLSPFYKRVAEVFDDAVSRSQSVSDQMHQGRLRKSKNPVARTITMFRSDSAQSYNVLRQRLGELDYYRRQGEGGADMAAAMKASAGAAATAILINSLWGTAVDLLVKALKGKLDEEDKEPLEIAEDFFWGVVDSYAGLSAAGDILAELVGGWFTGETRYDTEAPGVEQFNDIMDAADKVINAGKKGNVIGAIKTAAETIAIYGGGISVKNVEAYLKGLLSAVLPGVVVAYEDLLQAPVKADLKGLEGEALVTRMNNVLKGYGLKLDRESREELAKLYEAGFREVVPSAAPNSVTVDGVELELDERMRKAYDKIRSGIIGVEIEGIMDSAFWENADEKTRKTMLTKLYNYAAEKSKEAVLEGYAIQTSAQEIDEIVRAGGSAADYAIFDAVTADMAAWQKAAVLQEWGVDEDVTALMFKHLVSKSWEDELAELAKVQVDVGQFLELYSMHGEIDAQNLSASEKATNFAYWLDGQRYNDDQKAAIKDQMAFFQFMPAEASRYNTATAAGLDREQALELTEDLNALEPPEGKTTVQDIQKYRAAIDNSVSESNQLKMLAAVGLKDSSYDKVAMGLKMGVAPAAWVRVKEVQLEYDANGNGSMTNAEWEAAVDGICAYGVVLPGDTQRFNLTIEQKAVLWQMLVSKSTKATNNPFSPEAGRRWREAMGYE